MNVLTTCTKDKNTISTLEIAEMMDMEHGKLLRKIEGSTDRKGYVQIITEAQMGVSEYFSPSAYKDASGKENKCYLVTKLGCDFLANKFTGEKGILFTAKYVKRFHEMEEMIKPKMPTTYLEALKELVAKEEENQRLIADNSNLQNENDLLSQKILEWADRPLVTALVRAYGYYLGGEYAKAWRDFKKELLYRYGININARKTAHLNNGGCKSKRTMEYLTDDELPNAISTAVAICREHDIDISDIISNQKN